LISGFPFVSECTAGGFIVGELFILDAGRADCIVIITSGDANTGQTVVIDGGTKDYCGRAVLLNFLCSKKIKTIDLLIVTHVHQDHFGGLWHLIDRIHVKRAVLPYGDIELSPDAALLFDRGECFTEYHDFFGYLAGIHTEILLDYECAGKEFTLYQNTTVCCRYPDRALPSENAEYIARLCAGAAPEELKKAAAGYRATCNAASSIWTLENSSRTIALFASDSTVETMNRVLPLPRGAPDILKLSHHGINDGARYFSAGQIRVIAPKKNIVVSTSYEYYEAIQKTCREACAPSGLEPYYTFSGDFSYLF
jgi:competence protein ComEC